jgi:hypothetical protein
VEKREREAVQAGVGYDKITAERSRAVPVGPEFRNLEEGNRRCSSYRGYFVLSAHGLGEGKDLDWIGLDWSSSLYIYLYPMAFLALLQQAGSE